LARGKIFTEKLNF
jgi:hypothetical protein